MGVTPFSHLIRHPPCIFSDRPQPPVVVVCFHMACSCFLDFPCTLPPSTHPFGYASFPSSSFPRTLSFLFSSSSAAPGLSQRGTAQGGKGRGVYLEELGGAPSPMHLRSVALSKRCILVDSYFLFCSPLLALGRIRGGDSERKSSKGKGKGERGITTFCPARMIAHARHVLDSFSHRLG